MEEFEIADLRNLRHVGGLGPGLNVFAGRNARARRAAGGGGPARRGRSFRTDEVRTLIRNGSSSLHARVARTRTWRCWSEAVRAGRRLRVDEARGAAARASGRLEVIVCSTERLKVIRGSMRERRNTRPGAVALGRYRRALRDYERVVQQRNALLEMGGPALKPGTEADRAGGTPPPPQRIHRRGCRPPAPSVLKESMRSRSSRRRRRGGRRAAPRPRSSRRGAVRATRPPHAGGPASRSHRPDHRRGGGGAGLAGQCRSLLALSWRPGGLRGRAGTPAVLFWTI